MTNQAITRASRRFPDANRVYPGAVRFCTCPSHLFHLSQKPWNFASPPDTLSGMHKIIEIFADRAALHTEILALRQQVAVLKRKRPRPSLRKADRVFWVILSCLWPGWRHALVIVRPETVIGWHRKGFRLFWTWKSRRRKPGRPPVSREITCRVRPGLQGWWAGCARFSRGSVGRPRAARAIAATHSGHERSAGYRRSQRQLEIGKARSRWTPGECER